jgi:CBS domain-containing protein/sporulation protein YlmC with PRC-barrel domain
VGFGLCAAFAIQQGGVCFSIGMLWIEQEEPMAFVSELIGRTVTDQDGKVVGTLKDLIARKTEFAHPVIMAIVIKRRVGELVLPYSSVAVLFSPAIPLKTSMADTHPFAPEENDIFLARDVLDKQIIDTDGARVVRVNDVELVRVNGKVAVSNVDIGVPGILRRLGLRGLAASLAHLKNITPESYISWDDVELLAYDQKMQLKVPRQALADLHPADVAEIISDMNKLESNRFLEALDVEQLADTLESVEPEFQASLVEGMTDERVADVLEEMEPDEAADLLAELPPERSEDLLALMEQDEAEDVRKLLAYPEDSAGGIMTTEFATVHPEMTASEALTFIRENAADAETVFYVYVVDDENHLVGVCSLRSLVFANPLALVEDIMIKRIISVEVTETQEEIAQMVSKYDLLALPVVDSENRIQGIVTADDALDKIIPTAWKKRLPRFFR